MRRKLSFSGTASAVALLLAFSVTILAGDDAPDWMRQAASIKTRDYEKNVNAVVLYKEDNVTLDDGGRLVTTEKYVVRILTREGRNEAVAVESYLPDFSKIKDMQAWLITPGGTVTSYGKKDIIDRISNTNDIYNEVRLKIIDGSTGADSGYVFGYTLTKEDQPLFYQDNWLFQDDLPTLVSRYSVSIPGGWKATGLTFNHAEIAPKASGNTYTWELRDLPPIAHEPMSPSFANLAPRLAINFTPANANQALNRSFADWIAVSKWASAMYDPQVVIDDNLAAKTRELVAGAKTELDVIRAIGTFVQNMQYIALDIGMGYGNGMRPRPSNEVLSRGYADCKNKANLMRAMLKVMRIEAYPIAIYSGDPNYVRKEFPSPDQFNHCIIAIKVSDETKAATVVDNEKLGRLLIFDATDPYTPVGDLPDHLQGSFAVLVAGDNGGLVRMPLTPPETDALERNIEVVLSGTGEIKGMIREQARGQFSTAFRAEFRTKSASDYQKMVEKWLSSGATGARVENVQAKDGTDSTMFDFSVAFSAANYGQLMQGRLLVFKPVIVGRRNSVYLTDSKRTNPIEFDSSSMKETAVFTLPDGFKMDEMPDASSLVAPFGKYLTKYEVKDNKLFFTRELSMTRMTLPVEKYAVAKDFFTKIREAEQAPVVLIRK